MMQVVVPDIPADRKIIVSTPSGQQIAIQVPPGVSAGQTIQVQVPASAAPPVQTVTITVPAESRPGQQIRVRAPDGQEMAVVLPPGVRPGQQIQVQLPAPTATTATKCLRRGWRKASGRMPRCKNRCPRRGAP